MKQFTRVVTRPDNISETEWKLSLLGIHRAVETGVALVQGSGIFAATFVDLSNFTIIITIIQFEHATQADITEIHQATTEFSESLQKL